MPQPGQHTAHAVAVADVGAVRVALFVGVRVVLAMVGDPGNHRALDGHRAEHGKDVLEWLGGLEGTVGEETVKADRDADRGRQVHRRCDRKVVGVDQAVPKQHDRGNRGGEGNHHSP